MEKLTVIAKKLSGLLSLSRKVNSVVFDFLYDKTMKQFDAISFAQAQHTTHLIIGCVSVVL